MDPEGFEQQKALQDTIASDALESALVGANADAKDDVFMQGEDDWEERKEGEGAESEHMDRGVDMGFAGEEMEETKEGELALEITGTKIRANSVESAHEEEDNEVFLEWK